MEIFKLFGSVLVNTSGAEGSLDKTGKKAEGLGSTFSSVFKKIGAVVTTYLSAKALINFGRECIELASDVQEMENKFNVVFQGMTDEVNAWAESYAAAIGRNSNTIKGYLADNQNMFVGMGMTRQAGAALSEQMVSLALDLASFNNLNEDDAVNAMAKALMGESESAKSLGAVINDNTLAMAMEKMGYEGKFQALTEAEKMEVRYQAILMQSTDAVGDCARSLDSYKGRQLQLKATTENLKETIGSALLPVMTRLMEKANDAASGLSNKLEPAMELVSSGAMFVVDHLDEIVTGLALVGGAIVTLKAGFTLQKLVTGFQQAQVSIALLQMTTKGAALEQAALNGTLTVGETVVAILTGKISVMSLATAVASKTVAGLNAVIAANPIGVFVAALGLMAGGIYASRKKIQALADDMVVQAQTTAEAEENLSQLKERLDEFEGNPNKWGTEKREEYAALKQAISETEEQLVQLQQAEEEAAAAAAEKAADPVEIFRAATEQYANDAAALAESFWETYDQIYSKVSGWFGLFDNASTDVETNVQKMMTAMQSQVDFNAAYTANLQALKEYGLGSLSEAFQSYGKDGAAYAQAIVSAVEQAGGATTEQGQQIINGFLEINQKVSESQNELSQTLTLLDGEFEGELKSMNETYAAAIEGLDKSKDAKKYAYDTFQAFLDGMNKRIPGIVDKCRDLGTQMNNAIQSGLSSKTVSATFTVYGGGSSTSSATSAKAYSSQENYSDASSASRQPRIVINQYIQQVSQTAADTAAATEAFFEQARWAIP